MKRSFLLTVLFLFLPLVAAADERVVATVDRVVDGDTIYVFSGGKRQKIRLIGVDAPEVKPSDHATSQTKRFKVGIKRITTIGKLASERLKDRLRPGHKVKLEFDKRRIDPHGRLLAYVFTTDGDFINAWLAREGLAWAITYKPNTRYQSELEKEEKAAKKRRVGIWE